MKQLEQLEQVLLNKINQTNEEAIRMGLRMALIEVYTLMSKEL